MELTDFNFQIDEFMLFCRSRQLRVKTMSSYINQKLKEYKSAKNCGTVIQQISAADELKKFKELLDMGIISQEEFDAKKKQLLDL